MMTPAEERALMRRVEDALSPQDVITIERLLTNASTIAPLDVVRDMTKAIAEDAAVKREWKDMVLPVLRSVEGLLRERNELIEREIELTKVRHDLTKLRVREILVPLVVGLIGIATTAAAWLFK